MVGAGHADALAVVQSEQSMTVLTTLHNQRLQAPDETITVPLEELATRLVQGGEPYGETPNGQVEVLSATLVETWLPRMADLQMLEFDADGEHETVTATPATSLQWLVVRPDRPDRDDEKAASAAAWTAAHLAEWRTQ